ncbi:O-succinylbenzoic acid--CoA ligase [Corynebacterium sp. 13CS0277]|uniref:o-succinylbenzoate--CoA ligase n=1 Tax=Corynebacterium sp. 13CS0277 TaxID=2071994 RepID=UPI000D044393|nr:o-succinylbenzoate--CoA ligase [Corynebacterium sp. 13CS0277]PRQ10662.1 O-succinylbenzoic acid--CoA ligase [Corynebacterium sp. 13CS0277]
MSPRLHATTFHPARTDATLEALRGALSGVDTILPLPPGDPQGLARLLRAGEDIDPEIAVVVPTSGSTGTPKGALLTPENLISSADATHQRLGGEGQWLLALPPHHIAGIQVLTRSLVAGTEPVVLDVSGGFSVRAFATAATAAAEAATASGTALYTALVPMQLAKAMDTLEGIRALRLFEAILIGGGPLDKDVRASAEKLGIRVVATYGSSETSGGCVYDGLPLPGARVRITGGRVYLGGPMVAAGYRNPITPNPFAEGWYATSDAGRITDGRLEITGRIDAIINSGGMKIQPEVVEATLRTLPGVRDACAVGLPDARLGQMLAAAYTGPARAAEVLAALDEQPAYLIPKRLLRLDELPTTGPGKVDRAAVARLF